MDDGCGGVAMTLRVEVRGEGQARGLTYPTVQPCQPYRAFHLSFCPGEHLPRCRPPSLQPPIPAPLLMFGEPFILPTTLSDHNTLEPGPLYEESGRQVSAARQALAASLVGCWIARRAHLTPVVPSMPHTHRGSCLAQNCCAMRHPPTLQEREVFEQALGHQGWDLAQVGVSLRGRRGSQSSVHTERLARCAAERMFGQVWRSP